MTSNRCFLHQFATFLAQSATFLHQSATFLHQAPSLGVVVELLLGRRRALLQAAEEILGEVLRHVAKLVVVFAGRILHHPLEALDGALGQVADCTRREP